MTRFALIAALALACNAPVAKEVEHQIVTLEHAEEGVYAAGLNVIAGANAEAAGTDVEIEIMATGLLPEGAEVSLMVLGPDGIIGTADYVESSEQAPMVTWSPNFVRCEGVGYSALADGGCEVELGVLIVANGQYQMLPAFAIRAFLDREDRVEDKDAYDVWIDASVAQPAEQ
jgi:hypothetical protein